ncbi:MAG: hypothetical protein Q8O64_18665 [Sideroxyarcus sp.]|nr:hypothetical protein [Sideroxyarcus sp.]
MTCSNPIVFALFALLLAGCGSMPKTPELLIQNVKGGSMFSEQDVFEVKRPVTEVSEVLKNKAHECLKQKVSSTSNTGGPGIQLMRTDVRAFTPKVVVGKQRARLTLQTKVIEGSTELGDIPPDGWYMMVVDAYSVDSRTTRVETYFQQPGYRGAFTAIKLWATGKNMGCPDLTK